MDKEFAEVFQEEIVNEGKIEELGKQITGLADKFKEGKDDVMTMADEMITNGKMPDPELIKMLETGESQMIVHLIAKKMGVQWTKDNGYGEMRFKQNYPEAVFVKHKMYDPKTGKSVDVNTQDDHEKYKKMGYTHKEEVESQVKKLADRFRSMARKEEVEIDEKKSATGYELYHKDFSSAMQHAYAFAKSKGHVVDPKEIDDKVATGPKKPSSGKTNRYSLKAGRKTVEIQVANLDNKRYELNMYIEEVEVDARKKAYKEAQKRIESRRAKVAEKKNEVELVRNKWETSEGIDIQKADMKDVIKDFQTSDAPQFKGKSDKKKKEMAIAAKLSKEENEDDDLVGKKKKKSNKDVINLKPTAESSMKKFKDMMTKLKEKRFGKEEGRLNEALTPKDKEVINTFYSKETLGGKLLSTDGKSLEKHGLGGQTIAVWKNNKIVVTAVSDVKSTDTILNYMKKSIPKLNFDKKSWQEFFEEVEVAEKFAGWIAIYRGKELEIKKSEADGIWPAKQLAIKHFKVPKSKLGLLAIAPAHEEVTEGWKKGKYTIKDENGKILGTYSSGGKAKKVMDDLMQKGDYPELTVSMVEEVEVDEGIRDFKLGDKVKFANDDSDFWGQTGKITSLSGNGISQKATVKLNKGGKSVTNVLVKVDLIKEEVEIDDLFTKMIEPADAYTESIKKYSEYLVDKTKNLIDEAKGTAYPATVETLRKIVKDKQHQTVMFKSGQAIVDLFTASAMIQVYDALKPKTKTKFEAMIKDKAGFMKSQAFAMKMMG